MREDNDLYLLIIVNALKGLSSAGLEQISFYPEYVPASDELALTFESALPLVRKLVIDRIVADKIFDPIGTIDRILTEVSESGDTVFWEDSGLLKDERWSTIRQEAKRALYILGPDIRTGPFDPNLS